jgi:16S rRNA (guanine527-N7)-methyltransferase
MNDLYQQLAARAGLALDSSQLQKLGQYLDILFEASQRMNLTGIKDRAAAQTHHVGDALTLLPLLPNKPHRIADVGSGGGIPGIILAIARPDAQITLIESTQKKADFLKSTAATLELNNITVAPTRAEDAGLGPLRESFDVAVARAVGATDRLAEWLLPLVCVQGIAIAMKGPKLQAELPDALSAIRLLGGGDPEILPADSPAGQNLVFLRIPKLHPTPRRYPRPPTAARGKLQ